MPLCSGTIPRPGWDSDPRHGEGIVSDDPFAPSLPARQADGRSVPPADTEVRAMMLGQPQLALLTCKRESMPELPRPAGNSPVDLHLDTRTLNMVRRIAESTERSVNTVIESALEGYLEKFGAEPHRPATVVPGTVSRNERPSGSGEPGAPGNPGITVDRATVDRLSSAAATTGRAPSHIIAEAVADLAAKLGTEPRASVLNAHRASMDRFASVYAKLAQ